MGGVNLIPASRKVARARRDRCHAWYAGTGLYACALMAIWIGAHLWWPDQHRVLADELAKVQQQTEASAAALKAIRPQVREAMTTLGATRSVGNRPDWSLLLIMLSDLLGPDSVLSTCTLTVADTSGTTASARHVLTLAGLARSHGAVLTYVRALEEAGLFHSVTLIDTRQEPFASGHAIAFRIECILMETSFPAPQRQVRADVGATSR